MSVVHAILGHAEEADESLPHLPVVLNKEISKEVGSQYRRSLSLKRTMGNRQGEDKRLSNFECAQKFQLWARMHCCCLKSVGTEDLTCSSSKQHFGRYRH